mgnify:CR=1 FL=1
MLNAKIEKHLSLCTEKIEAHVAKITEHREKLDTLWRQLNNTRVDTTDEDLIKGFDCTKENVESSLKANPSCCRTDILELLPVDKGLSGLLWSCVNVKHSSSLPANKGLK